MIFVTGHTDGIGEALHKKFGGLGFSRSNGYDLREKKDREKMYAQLDMCSVFINNAFPYGDDNTKADYMWTQTQILYDVYEKINKESLIINIGSNTVDENQRRIWPYQSAKAGLHKACKQLQYIKGGPKVCSIRLGFCETKKILKKYKPSSYVTLDKIYECINYIIKSSNEGYLINDMSVNAYE